MPDPTPVDGISLKPRDDRPCSVIVTTESRTRATTSGRSSAPTVGPGFEPAAVVTAPGAPLVAAGLTVFASGPVTRAAVPAAASTADRRAAPTIAAMPREPVVRGGREPDPDEPPLGPGAGSLAGAGAGW